MEIIQEFWLQFTTALGTVRWNDVLDIAVVSYIIYKLIQIVRGTRAMLLVKGIFIIALVYAAVQLCNLSIMKILFDRLVLQSAIIAVIVLFQQEIRHGIEQIGRSKISDIRLGLIGETDNTEAATLRTIDAVVGACQHLRMLKMGALIVFERDDSLSEIISSGTIVNANPTVELIGNIFFNKAPLHDGAMVIRDNRVHAAGCILPLTQSTDISSELGTRHRAGIGMSENSDAVVIIVSEETGQFSVAYKGGLKRDYTRDTLKKQLEHLLIGDKAPKAPEHRFFGIAAKKERKAYEERK